MLSITPVLLYPETHFKFFRFFPSFIFKKAPEILFDLPRRLDPHHDLPVILIMNDIDRYKAQCLEVKISVSYKKRPPILFQFSDLKQNSIEQPFSFQSSVFLFTVPRKELQSGLAFINCTATVQIGKHKQTIINDNFITSSKLPFSCFISDESLPAKKYCSYGDLHVHSHFSQSHVEFGPPIQIIDLFSKCYGADFVSITDHSYDLACSMENYLKPDQMVKRWEVLKQEIEKKKYKTVISCGEEISCLNSKGNVVHLCGFGLSNFIPGTLDGARKKAGNQEQLSILEAIALIQKQQGVAFAAHPGSKSGFMQRLFLKRGTWSKSDLNNSINGLQAVNNGFGQSWHHAKVLWINELLKGKKIAIIAGNDCHGDFNRYRSLSVPFIKISEAQSRYFCSSMTGLYKKIDSNKELVDLLKNGNTFITTGPMLCISTSDSTNDSIIGKNIKNVEKKLITIILSSSYEFGIPSLIRLFWGNYAIRRETLFFAKQISEKTFSINSVVDISKLKGSSGYLRAEAECVTNDGTMHYAATSPFYFSFT
jgi:hypothetical protein